MQTAVQFLFEKLWNTDKDKFTWYSILKQAKEMEKQQIIDAYANGSNDRLKNRINDYYNETYGEQLKSK